MYGIIFYWGKRISWLVLFERKNSNTPAVLAVRTLQRKWEIWFHNLWWLLRTLNHIFYLLLRFGKTLSPIPLRKQVWKTKAKSNQNKIMFPLCNWHVLVSFFPTVIQNHQTTFWTKTVTDGSFWKTTGGLQNIFTHL